MNTDIDLITGAKIVAQQAPDREEEFRKEFGFQSSEMDFVHGYAAACLHLIDINRSEIIPFASTNAELFKKGLAHYTHAALLAEEFSGDVLASLPPVSQMPQFVTEHFSPPKSRIWKILQPLVDLFW